jgi:DNA-binding GntR family transcriptional regulator
MPSKKRKISRDRVIDAVWENVLSGKFEPGQRIVEATLAAEVGVSRTPVREALLGLQEHGIVEHAHGSGFRVRDFSATELQEVYPIRAILETTALRISCNHFGPDLRTLDSINERLVSEDTTAIVFANADAEWHRVLVAGCGNRTLLTILEQLRRQSVRYQFAYDRSEEERQSCYDQHKSIAECIKKRDVDGACDQLQRHLFESIHPVLEWLRHRES